MGEAMNYDRGFGRSGCGAEMSRGGSTVRSILSVARQRTLLPLCPFRNADRTIPPHYEKFDLCAAYRRMRWLRLELGSVSSGDNDSSSSL